MKTLVMASLAFVLSMIVGCTSGPSPAYSAWMAQQNQNQPSSGSTSEVDAEQLRRTQAELVCRRNHPPGSTELAECIREDATGGPRIAAATAASAAAAPVQERPRQMPYTGFGYGGLPGGNSIGGYAPPIPAQRVLAGYVGVGSSPADNEHIIRVYLQTQRFVAIRIGNDYVPIFRGSEQIWRNTASRDGSIRPIPVIPPGDEYTDIAVIRSGNYDVTLEYYAADLDGTLSLQRTEHHPVRTYPDIALIATHD